VTDHDLVLVVDFGAQYAQLIARRVREARVYSEIVPHTMPIAEMLGQDPAAIILSPAAPRACTSPVPGGIDPAVFEAGVPVFGICYGFQAMASGLGGEVAHRPGLASTGHARLVVGRGTLFAGHAESTVGVDEPRRLGHGRPQGFTVTASTSEVRPWRRSRTTRAAGYGVQWHPEVCTPRTASRCSSTSSTTSPVPAPTGR
jgi:GMP synthase (glutamine-hydrolysing)